MRAYCSVPDCYAPKSKYQLFHIPFNKETSLEWRRLVGSREEADKWHNAMVCEQVRMNTTESHLCGRRFAVNFVYFQHFNEEDFYVIPNSKTPGKRRLKRGAVPCLKLPDKSQLAEGRRTIMMEDASKSLTGILRIKLGGLLIKKKGCSRHNRPLSFQRQNLHYQTKIVSEQKSCSVLVECTLAFEKISP